MACAPPGHQRALAVAITGAPRRATPAPALLPRPDSRPQPVPARGTRGPALRPLVDPEAGRPPQADHPPAQPARRETTSRPYQHGPVRGERRAPQTQQPSPLAAPRPRLVRGQHRPGYGDRTPARDATDREHDAPRSSSGRVEGEGQLGPSPEGDDPGAEGHQTRGALQRLTCGARLLGRRAAPCLSALCDGRDLLPPQPREKGGDGAASTRAGHGEAVTPQGAHARLWLTAVGPGG